MNNIIEENFQVINTKTGTSYTIDENDELLIGGIGLLTLHTEKYFSEKHCVIRHEHGRLIIYDNGTLSGTLLNNDKLLPGINNYRLLNAGDYILIEEQEYMLKIPDDLDDYQQNNTKPKNLPVAYTMYCYGNTLWKLKLDFSKLMGIYRDCNWNYKNKTIYRSIINISEKLEHNIHKTIEMSYDLLKIDYEYKDQVFSYNEAIQEIKTKKGNEISVIEELHNKKVKDFKEAYNQKMLSFLIDNYQCTICSEVFIKAYSTSCGHLFCKYCLFQWMKMGLQSSKCCPICRTDINSANKSTDMNIFITKVYEEIGGAVLTKRQKLVKDRKAIPFKSIRENNSNEQPEMPEMPLSRLDYAFIYL